MYRRHFLAAAMILVRSMTRPAAQAARQLTISWDKNYLTIRGDFPGNEISILYLEAYCRPGSVDREWGQTIIKHTTQLVWNSEDGRVIKLHDELADGVVVDHTITAGVDDIDFQHYPASSVSRRTRELGIRQVVKSHLFSRSQSECLCLRPIIGMNRNKHRTVHMSAYKAAVNMIGTTTM